MIYGFTYLIGAKLIGLHSHLSIAFAFDWYGIVSMIDQAPIIFMVLTIGGVIVGLPIATIGYFACYAVVERYQERLKDKLANQKERLKQKMVQRKAHRHNKKRAGR